MLERVSSHELTEWEAYEGIAGPLELGDRLDALFAMLQATIANVNRDRKTRPYKAEQFVPKWERRQQVDGDGEMSPEDMLRAVKRIHKAMGG